MESMVWVQRGSPILSPGGIGSVASEFAAITIRTEGSIDWRTKFNIVNYLICFLLFPYNFLIL